MYKVKSWLLSFLGFGVLTVASAHINPELQNKPATTNQENTINFREDCDNSISQIDMSINNVRARLLTGGDVWWDSDDGRYVVPKVPAGETEISSIFAGAVWLGGVDPAGNLKLAAQTYGRPNNFDFYSGPLDPETGKTEQNTCAKWDKFFIVNGDEIEEHLRNFAEAESAGIEYDQALIPDGVKGWPAKGNEFFFDIHEFELPNTSQGLAGFFDQDGDGDYNPERGDFPVIEIRGCVDPQFPDQMIFWIYNDAGNIHRESQGDPIQMEVQVQAFAYTTNDEINDMTFQRYKLINRAIESIDSMFFAMWVDPDLGCYTDDYIGCDTLRSLAFVYNEDAVDGTTGCSCDQGVNTYCEDVPILGVDYFRGPLDELGKEIGMSSFTYYNNGSVGTSPPGTHDPNTAQEFYNYLSGSWRDGSPFTFGDDAYQDGESINYAFTEAPDDQNGWSMCTAGLPFGDRRTVQASGPFRLDPGAVNELIIGVVWVPDQTYPCPSIRKLQEADDIAQALFDNCFDITDGPDAPDVDWIELDKEIIAVLTNDTLTSNNAFEAFAEPGLQIPPLVEDSLYRFEGYKLYQFSSSNVTISDLNNPDRARLIYQVDVKNGVGKIFNWNILAGPDQTPTEEEVFVPELMVDGQDQGIRHTFRITEDQFAEGDRRLINHKKYYFTAIAYAYNNYEPFDPKEVIGQRKPYLEGRRNIGDRNNPFYTVIPRPITSEVLNADYGDGAIITRIDGVGNGGQFLDLSEESRRAIEESFGTGDFSGEITYRPGRGPIEISVFNPLDVKDGEFELTFIDEDMSNDILDKSVRWELRSLTDASAPVISAQRTIDKLNEQIIKEFGFSVTIGQVAEVGARQDPSNGVVGYEESYTAGENAEPWLSGIPDSFSPGDNFFDQTIFSYVANDPGEVDEDKDPDQAFSNIGPGYFVPYFMANWRDDAPLPYITPAWTNGSNSIVRSQLDLADLNNIDIVLTPNTDLWSRCVIVETASEFYNDFGFFPEGPGEGKSHFSLRSDPNVTQFDNDGDGLPDIDTEDPGTGMGWFPGYAIDVETGQRLNIFFGENSVYDCDNLAARGLGPLCDFITQGDTGGDMMFNPTSEIKIPSPNQFANLFQYVAGGHHYIYVSKLPYDECALFRDRLDGANELTKVRALRELTWAGLIVTQPGTAMTSYADGLIPEEVTVKLRVDNPYQVAIGTGDFNGYPTYRFKLEGVESSQLDQAGVENALDMINVVPNPYYGFSDYETSQFTTTVKITNLPAKATVTIYSLDGKFIRQYTRDEVGAMPVGNNRALDRQQIVPDLEWDLKNNKQIPIASGVYLIHIKADGLGERTIKWFGVNRKFDPSGL